MHIAHLICIFIFFSKQDLVERSKKPFSEATVKVFIGAFESSVSVECRTRY